MTNAYGQLRALEKRFPAFKFRLDERFNGRCFIAHYEAVRRGGSAGGDLYAVISTSPAEVADELSRAA